MRPSPLVAVFALPGSTGGKACWCAAARAFAQSLLEGPASGGVDGPAPSMLAMVGDAWFG